MVKKGDLIEFKPGLFGIEPPENYGIFIRRFRHKSTKKHMVEIYTLKGKQTTSQSNLQKTKLSKTLQLKDNRFPETKIVKQRLESWINELERQKSKMEQAAKQAGQLSEQALWKKITDDNNIQSEYTLEEIASTWFKLDPSEISRNRLKKVNKILKDCAPTGKGYFDFVSGNQSLWKPITQEEYQKVKQEINELGQLRNSMFEMVEMELEELEDEEETQLVRQPIAWQNLILTQNAKKLLEKIQIIMAYFVEHDSWPPEGLGGTLIYALDGFSQRNFISYLAEDWVNEGRTSYADAFVKFLIKTQYWNDSEALIAISKRNVLQAPNFSWTIGERIEEIAARYKEPSTTPGSFEGRLDLRELEAYTIDPPTAKDFDDAISLIETDEEYILWVHIADVAHYVEKDSSLDLHARRKATSVYLPTKTLPMLPTHLSDNLCSLVEQTPRLTMSVEIHYDKEGRKLSELSKVHDSVITVNENLSYDYVNDQIASNSSPFSELYQFSTLINQYRRSLNLETDDVRLELGGQMALAIKTSSPSTKMIETFMVAANETIAEILRKENLPAIYRNHPLPDQQDVEKFNAQSEVINLGCNIEYPDFSEKETDDIEESTGQSLMDMLSSQGGNISFSLGSGTSFADEMKKQLEVSENEDSETEETMGKSLIKGLAQLTPDQQEQILTPFRNAITTVENLEDEHLRKLGYLTVLRTLSRALYGAGNMGHFGLGSNAYIHFTSPIRRYPDVIAHRICKSLISDQEVPYTEEEIEELAEHCTAQSETAEKLEKTIIGAGFSFLTRNPSYVENNQGIVVSIFGGGVFVLLPNGIEARVPLSKLTSKPTFVDDYETMCFIGSRSDFNIQEELTPENWKDMLEEGSDDPIEVITKIGDKMAVEFVKHNHVEGKVEAAPVAIYERVDDGYIEKILDEEEFETV